MIHAITIDANKGKTTDHERVKKMKTSAIQYQQLFINPVFNAEKKTQNNITKNPQIIGDAMTALKQATEKATRNDGTLDTAKRKTALGEWVFLTANENRSHLYALRQLIKANVTVEQIAEKQAVKPVKSIAGIWDKHFKQKTTTGRNSAANGGNAGGNGANGSSENVDFVEACKNRNMEYLAGAIARMMAASNYGGMNSADIDAALRDIAKAMLKDNGISQNAFMEYRKLNRKAA